MVLRRYNTENLWWVLTLVGQRPDGAAAAADGSASRELATACASGVEAPDRVDAMNTRALRKELKGLGVRNSFLGATKPYMAHLLNRRKHNTGEVPPQLLTAEALRMARSTEYRELLGKRSLKELALHLPTRLWKHYKKFGWLQFDLSLTEREKRMVALCHRVALCELVRRQPYTKALCNRSCVCAARRLVGHTGCRPDRHVDVCRE